MDNKKQLKNNILWNTIGTTLNAFNSLLFAIIVTRINGINDAGIFTYSYATACVLFVIGIYFGRTFQVTDLSSKYSDTDYIFNKVITSVFMVVVALGFCIIKKYDIYKTTIFVLLCSFKALEAFSESIYGILQKNEKLDQVGKSFTMKAVLCIVAFLIIDLLTKNLILACISICLVWMAVTVLYDTSNLKKIELHKTKYTSKTNNELLKIGFFTFLLTFFSQYIINSSRYAIDDLLTNDLQTIYGIIIMPATFMALLGQFIIQPILNKLTNCIKENQKNELKKLIFQIFAVIIGVGIVTLIGTFLLGTPLLGMVYGLDLSSYLMPLMIIIAGATLYSIELFASTVLIALRKTFLQAMAYVLVAIISTIIAYYLVEQYSILGASISYFITMALIAIVLVIYMFKAINKNLVKKSEG